MTYSTALRAGRSLRVTLVFIIITTIAPLVALAGEANAAAGSADPADGIAGQCLSAAAAQQYPNGLIPLTALCAVWSAPGEYLRADAAYNFNRLSKAYAKRFGLPICVTDSYRSLAAQKNLYKAKPKLAAVPGTSNHGWGVAADLCGGVQRFSTLQHVWLSQNAPKYRWVHPDWAQQNGSRPEPWHWEYAPRSPLVRDALGLPPLPHAMMTSWMANQRD